MAGILSVGAIASVLSNKKRDAAAALLISGGWSSPSSSSSSSLSSSSGQTFQASVAAGRENALGAAKERTDAAADAASDAARRFAGALPDLSPFPELQEEH